MHKKMFKTAALLMAIAVTLGAFGAHLLKKYLTPSLLEGYQTATYYQMIHAIAIFITGFLYKQYHNKKLWIAGQLFFYGILCFSGSIYARVALSFVGYTSLGLFNLVTPIGGILFIIGWLLLLISSSSKITDKHSVNDAEK
jgi:uncharacterized membrane protein YgdD (TMEM256/DUF423 family)